MTRSFPLLAALALFCALPFRAESALVDPQIDGNEFSATIELPGDISAELTVRFEQVVGLSVEALGVSVKLINPLSLSLLRRLPNTTDFALPSGFPVMITIAPDPASGLAFEGVVEIEIYTRNLQYISGTPLRLFSAPAGGTFRDITDRISGGSYRPRGSSGHFSDFLIVADTRPLATAINDKFNRLEQHLLDHTSSIDMVVADQLDQTLSDARALWQAGDPGAAIDEVSAFEQLVKTAAGDGQMPRVWSAAGNGDNVDGILRSGARTLRFNLTLAYNLL